MGESDTDWLVRLFRTPVNEAKDVAATLDSDHAKRLLDLSIAERIFPKIASVFPDHHLDGELRKYGNQRKYAMMMLEFLSKHCLGRVDFVVVKGPTIESYLPAGTLRFFHDVDIVVPDASQLWILVDILRSRGMTTRDTTANFWLDPASGELLGAMRWWLNDSEESVENPGLEVLIGMFPEKTRRWLPAQIFVPRSTVRSVGGIPIPTPDATGSLLVYFAELAQRDISLRELLDIEFLCSGVHDITPLSMVISDMNWGFSVHRVVHAYESRSLEPPAVVKELATVTRSIAPPTPTQERAFDKLVKVTSALNERNKLLGILRFFDTHGGTRLFLRNGQYVYGYLVSRTDTADAWRLIRRSGHDFLMTPVGTYLVSAHFLYSDEELDYLQEQVTSVV